MAVGLLLAGMVPDMRDKFYNRIQDYGFSRMIAGAHFRSDVYAGQLLGAAMITVFYQNPQFTGVLAEPALISEDLSSTNVPHSLMGQRMAGIAPDLSIRSYRQRPSDHTLAGSGFGVLRDGYAHSSLRLRTRPAFGLVISLWHARAKDVSCFLSSRSGLCG